MFEVFVYSPRVEAVHLRGGKVARGGIRWSDRLEDFRTEILGLVKSQMVKNAVIVPVGAKGGFIVKRPTASRDELQREGIECYKTLIRGLLDITDNFAGSGCSRRPRWCAATATIPTWWWRPTKAPPPFPTSPTGWPPNTASGWATPSLPAARSATTTRRWRSPPAAPGNRSSGISARWAEQPDRALHLRRRRRHGRRRLRQRHAALRDHAAGRRLQPPAHLRRPAARPARSLAERRRLFDLPRSTWNDYDRAAISEGGAIFERSAKKLTVSPRGEASFSAWPATPAPRPS